MGTLAQAKAPAALRDAPGDLHDLRFSALLGTTGWARLPAAVRAVKREFPNLVVVTDVCMCEYTDHGHCGILDGRGSVDNDRTLAVYAKIAIAQARLASGGVERLGSAGRHREGRALVQSGRAMRGAQRHQGGGAVAHRAVARER